MFPTVQMGKTGMKPVVLDLHWRLQWKLKKFNEQIPWLCLLRLDAEKFQQN